MDRLMLKVNERDNVAVALREIVAGTEVEVPGRGVLKAADDIPYGHKIALEEIPEGHPVVKYGETIGLASTHVPEGGWVHTQNMGPVEVNS
ncbi:MAG TPA: UxaA family hydrolase [Candidatus Anoxymicrobiaceae bacterium]